MVSYVSSTPCNTFEYMCMMHQLHIGYTSGDDTYTEPEVGQVAKL